MTFASIIATVLTLSSPPYTLGGELKLVERVNLPTVEARTNQRTSEQPVIFLSTLASLAQPEINLNDLDPAVFHSSLDPSISLNVPPPPWRPEETQPLWPPTDTAQQEHWSGASQGLSFQ